MPLSKSSWSLNCEFWVAVADKPCLLKEECILLKQDMIALKEIISRLPDNVFGEE